MYIQGKKSQKVKWSLKKALIFIFVVTFIMSGGSAFFVFFYKYQREERSHSHKYQVKHLIHKTSQTKRLTLSHLEEILDLSVDKPLSIYSLNLNELEERLNKYPVIQNASIHTIYPDSLYIEYLLKDYGSG